MSVCLFVARVAATTLSLLVAQCDKLPGKVCAILRQFKDTKTINAFLFFVFIRNNTFETKKINT